MESMRLPEHLQDTTSLNGADFVEYMNEIGWAQDGMFVALLSTLNYQFDKEGGRMVTRKWYKRVAPALFLLISEL